MLMDCVNVCDINEHVLTYIFIAYVPNNYPEDLHLAIYTYQLNLLIHVHACVMTAVIHELDYITSSVINLIG